MTCQYQVKLVDATAPIAVLSDLTELRWFVNWLNSAKNNCAVVPVFGGTEIAINPAHVSAISGPNKPFDSHLCPVRFHER